MLVALRTWVARSRNRSYTLKFFQSRAVTRQRVRGFFSRALRRRSCWSRDRWSQNLRTRAPSSASIRSKRLIRSRAWSSFACLLRPSMWAESAPLYQDPKKMPIFPRGGRERQNRHMGGRSRSSSEASPGALVSTWRGSSHSFRMLTVSPLPAPSTPLMRITTGKPRASSRSYWASSRASRRGGTRALQVFLSMAWSSSADSNIAPSPVGCTSGKKDTTGKTGPER